MVVGTQNNIKNGLEQLETLHHKLSAWGDWKSSQAINDLMRKKRAGEFTIAVCGHFSAGKSSLINKLCGMTILPSGPVPTSANVVMIRNGVSHAIIYPAVPTDVDASHEELMPLEVSTTQLDDYCKNGGEYSSIEVWDHIPFLGANTVLMDTPGVDSTDDGHQKATHSALHLADVVLYVMDYNHVQSENNLMFAKSLSDWGKPLYLIVNQIDKHQEHELSFLGYHEEVVTAFERWQVAYEGILYNSLKEMNHPYNQHDRLKSLITDLIVQREVLVDYSVSCSVQHVAEEHLEQYTQSLDMEKESLLEELGGEEWLGQIEAQKASLELEQTHLEGASQNERELIRIELNKLLDNSNLMPAEMRELAQLYLESRRPGFKKGLWLVGNKTLVEQEQRKNQFLNHLGERVASQVEYHVRHLISEWAAKHDLWSVEWQKKLDLFIPSIDEAMVSNAYQNEATLSGEYVLNYCTTVSELIKSHYRRRVTEFHEQLLLLLEEAAARELQQLRARMADLQQQSAASSRYAALLREEAAHAAALAELLPPRQALTPGILPVVGPLRPPAPAVAASALLGALRVAPALAPPPRSGGATGGAAGGRRQRLADAAAQLQGAAALLGQYPAMATAARGITERAAALHSGTFTLALFGAFSAGKSSFANALLGEDVLPVSPHPTTAAINRILAPQGEMKHGTAHVIMKSRESWMEDLRISFEILHLGTPDPLDWCQTVNHITSDGIHPAGLPHYTFLKAASAGWKDAEKRLGSVQSVDLAQYRAFVADESKSCFVERIDLFYSCDLTEQGIILVDTPGADSLHARHTGVTFQYMKYADAIVFVTYYNHAFTKGDRQFLSQLGRVKDSFALDKMYFIINASDLAGSSDELEQVKEHVKLNLRSSGIGSPHIYALSSMQALKGKISGDDSLQLHSGFTAFENSLNDFAGKELPGLSIQAARQEITSARMRADEWDRISRQDEVTRGVQRQELAKTWIDASRLLSQFEKMEGVEKDIEQETKELLFHVRQRIYYRIGTFFQESFHPSVLRDGAGSLKEIYMDCGRELEQILLREIDQEVWATTLRLELQSKKILDEAASRLSEQLQELDEGILLTNLKEVKDWELPNIQASHFHQSMDWQAVWHIFKSPKAFFEGKGREKLRHDIEPTLKEAIAEVVQSRQQYLANFYNTEFQQALHRRGSVLSEQLQESYNVMEETLQGADSLGQWQELSKNLIIFEQVMNDLTR
ncbi:dynamin family protein [Paenibacillus crassostreae]|uniref:Dynamin N-terminal domain-containing protein n=1 Tax=Paenibacillus crassostreae TaxID=1763538 RepID=A0A167DMR0_9BACL|nr:dynamin family protein [Paenibacillus crassostreae]AOZ91272.1 hypothetical protein LPB68_03020 [Paenibacillus crassostreae]OAB74568.1 hypothetical protein PNBC_10940 [Paenibacillus crassostreae]